MLKQDRIPRKHQLGKKFKVLIPTRDDWNKSKLLADPKVNLWFTDGSGANGRYGVGIYGPKRNHRESIPLGGLATVFQAEVMAILRYAETLAVNDSANQHFYICSDSRAAIHALAKTTTESAVVWDCMQALARLGESNKITLVWVPGHQGFLGNEIADELAKLGIQMDPATQIVGVPFVTGINIIRGWLEREHVGSWRAEGGCRTAKQLMEQPSPGRANELLAMNRLRLKVGLGLLTGHITLRSHLNKLGLTEQSDCRLCGCDGRKLLITGSDDMSSMCIMSSSVCCRVNFREKNSLYCFKSLFRDSCTSSDISPIGKIDLLIRSVGLSFMFH
ncbi:uncharacterized protein LOC116850698 [Odontomachus brunneus]|uniref:uncharacterized protein LOC116850698 n=1 Tax=Odontomachus brunneus TaxID=486640 RepID=UPI0013F25A92|nr:uncharacterized protein LOC116850698 [Odontomachus brunneus]